MKILIVTKRYSVNEESTDGTGKYVSSLCSSLAKKNKVVVVSRCVDRNKKDYSTLAQTRGNIRSIKIVKNSHPLLSTLNDPLFFARDNKIDGAFEDILLSEDPDIVHIHHLGNLSYSLIDIVKRHGYPLAITLHDFAYICNGVFKDMSKPYSCELTLSSCRECFRKFYYSRLESYLEYRLGQPFSKLAKIFQVVRNMLKGLSIEKLYKMRIKYYTDLLKRADAIIAPSKFVKNTFSGFVPASKISVIPHGIDISFVGKLAKANSKVLRFGYVGGPHTHKGIDVVLQACRWIKNAKLLLFGNEPFSPVIKRYKEKYARSKNIIFKGVYKSPETVFNNIDVLIIPSLCGETFSLALHESLAAKVPVIASRIGVFEEIINNNRNGFLFEAGSAKDLTDKINKITANPGLIAQFIKNIGHVKGLKEHVDELASLYSSLLH